MPGMNLGLGLGLSSAIKKWFLSDSYKADSVSPTLLLDFANNRYAANSLAKNFSDILTFSRASTATYFDANGVMQTAAINSPRFDHDPLTGEKLGLLIEENRTNSFTYSADLTNWIAPSGASISSKVVTSLDGTQNADLLLEDTSSSYHRVSNSVSVTSGTTYTISAFVKQKNRRYLYIRTDFFTSTVNNNICFDLQSGTVVYAAEGWTAAITMSANGWYRISLTATATSSATKQVYFSLANAPVTSDSLYTYTGDGASGVYVWGAQCEVGSFATSYIPTISAAVTRAADIVTNSVSNTVKFEDWYNQSGGTVLWDGDINIPNLVTWRDPWVLRGDSNNYIEQYVYLISGTRNLKIYNGGVNVMESGGPVLGHTMGARTKIASAYKLNNSVACSDGVLGTVDTSCTIPPLSLLALGQNYVGANSINGHIREFRFYGQRITNSELQRITA